MRKWISILILAVIAEHVSAQDTTFIFSVGGINNEKAVGIDVLPDGSAFFTANTGSFGAGSSDLYFGIVSTQATLATSWTWGGATEDLAIAGEVIDSTTITLGYRNTFEDNAYRYFLLSQELSGDFNWMYELDLTFDIDQHPILLVDSNGIWVAQIEDKGLLIREYNYSGIEQNQMIFTNLGIEGQLKADLKEDQILAAATKTDGDDVYEWVTMIDVENESIIHQTLQQRHSIAYPGFAVFGKDSNDAYLGYNSRNVDTGAVNINLYRINHDLDTSWYRGYAFGGDDFAHSAFINSKDRLTFSCSINSFGESGDLGIGRYDTSGLYVDLKSLGSKRLDVAADIDSNFNEGYWLIGISDGYGSSINDLIFFHTNKDAFTASNDFEKVIDDLEQVLATGDLVDDKKGQVYPNPILKGGRFKWNPSGGTSDVWLLDLKGRLVGKLTTETNSETYELPPHIKTGSYFVLKRENNGALSSTRIVVLDE